MLRSELATRYVGDMDRLFEMYTELLASMQEHLRERIPKSPADSDFVYRRALKAKALDAVRGILPAGALSNVGIYGSGQAYEALVLRLRASPLPEAQSYAELMMGELRKVIPSFLRRLDLPERGGVWVDYLRSTRENTASFAEQLFPVSMGSASEPTVTLVDFDPDGEDKVLAAMLYPYVDRSDTELRRRVGELSATERVELVRAYNGERRNRRHRPGRALEATDYRFDVLADYGAFRDLQRHRLLSIEWQPLTPRHGYAVPPAVAEAGFAPTFDVAMEHSADLHDTLAEDFPRQAGYAVALAYRLRFAMQMNAREAMHLLELRSAPQGHPSYRSVAQQMHRLIGERAGHHAIAEMMSFVDHSDEHDLERLDAERRTEQRRAAP